MTKDIVERLEKGISRREALSNGSAHDLIARNKDGQRTTPTPVHDLQEAITEINGLRAWIDVAKSMFLIPAYCSEIDAAVLAMKFEARRALDKE